MRGITNTCQALNSIHNWEIASRSENIDLICWLIIIRTSNQLKCLIRTPCFRRKVAFSQIYNYWSKCGCANKSKTKFIENIKNEVKCIVKVKILNFQHIFTMTLKSLFLKALFEIKLQHFHHDFLILTNWLGTEAIKRAPLYGQSGDKNHSRIDLNRIQEHKT